ncbi:hypothetical protein M2418_005049 [Rhizobium sp. BIGb0125]|jgi:hypothetical protein|nr:hypothetical protein [Rhizobium sp. BIGb0125]
MKQFAAVAFGSLRRTDTITAVLAPNDLDVVFG